MDCNQCGGEFSVEELLERSGPVSPECPHCGAGARTRQNA